MLFAAALLLFAWGIVIQLTGGANVRFAGLAIKSRDPLRVFIPSLVLIAGLAVFARKDLIGFMERTGAPFGRFAPWLAATLALALAVHGVVFGSFSVGGADSYGYVNQAYDWASGALPKPLPVELDLPFPDSDPLQIPLGYRQGPQRRTMVPTYAPGLPLVMAVSLLAGACGPFLVVPLSAIALIWFTYRIGERAASRSNGVLAAVLLVTSPVVLYQTLWPMSDVPAGAAWTGAVYFALLDTRRSAVFSGLLTALGLLIRPNLLPLAAVPGLQIMLMSRGRERWLRAVMFGIAPALVAVAVAGLNTSWYGSPTRSGYGTADELYKRANIWPNLKLYPSWFRESETAGVLLAALALVPFLYRRVNGRVVSLCLAVFLVTFGCYVSYTPFEVWWYLRFLIPAFGVLAVLAATGMTSMARTVPQPFGRIAVVVLIGMALSYRLAFAREKGVFGGLQPLERRYVEIGEFIDQTLPHNAALFSAQHSGSLRFYSGRYTLRFDWIQVAWGKSVIPALERRGLHPYLVIDDFEAAQVRRHFGIPADAPLPWPVRARMREQGGLTVFDMASAPETLQPVALEPRSKARCAPRHAPVR